MKEKLKIYVPGFILAVLAVAFAWQYVEPAPPDSIRLAVGPEDGSYAWLGGKYQELLRKQGLEIVLVHSNGSRDNLELIREGKADAGFVQSGVTLGKEEQYSFSFLASLYLEPLWVFMKGPDDRTDLLGLEGKTLAIGPEGSGSHFVAGALLKAVEVAEQNTLVLENTPEVIKKGAADFLFVLASPNSPQVLELLQDDSLALLSFRRADGIVTRLDSLSHLKLREGAVDLGQNLPAQDTNLLASAATLVVGQEFHPALTSVLLSAAQNIHGQPGPLQGRGDFPSPDYGSFPLTREAEYFHKNGPGFLQGKLPYKAAATLQRLIILLLPFLTIVLPLAKILPAIYSWRLNRRLHKPYKELLALENEVGAPDFLDRLQEVEAEARKLVDMPASYGAEVQHLLHHIERLKARHQAQHLTS